MAGDGSSGMTFGGATPGAGMRGGGGGRVGVPVDHSRREALRMAWRIGQGLLAAAAGYTTFVALRPLGNANEGGRVILGAPEGFTEGTATYVAAGRLNASICCWAFSTAMIATRSGSSVSTSTPNVCATR